MTGIPMVLWIGMRLRSWLAAVLAVAVLMVVGTGAALGEEAGVSHGLAMARAGRLSAVRYRLAVVLKEHSATVAGTETVAFVSQTAGDLAIDYRDGVVGFARLNGREISTELVNGHLNLPVVAGQNTLSVSFTSNAAAAGKAITRYEDKDDGSEYVYTLFVPMDASMAFPCFDQPDVKARFTLEVEHPEGWSVIGNTAPMKSEGTYTVFGETRSISTYLFAFAAGPFAEVRSKSAGEPTVWVRKSQLARAQQEAPQVQQMAGRGIAYLSDYFQQPFPFPKYDLVLIPGFPFGGMEHAGETFLNEDGVLFRSTPTASDYFRRNILVLHETCHQWFGDLVTMRWFDDLWLKEGFAQYMAYKAMAQMEPEANAWKHFYEEIKPPAYGIDETQGTTPIFQNIANLKDAKSAYGAIVYQKAPSVLKQLNYFLGEESFRGGLRIYLEEHAYANAEWADLVGAFARVSELAGAKKDVQGWAAAWILRRGMPQVEVSWSCKGGVISEFLLKQEDVLKSGGVWPIDSQIVLERGYPEGAGGAPVVVRKSWNAAQAAVPEAVGKACPKLVFANFGDESYGRFLLDPVSHAAAARAQPGGDDPLLKAMIWGALWEDVRIARSSPRSYVEEAVSRLGEETDESLARVQAGRIATALHAYLGPKSRAAMLPKAEAVIGDRMLHAPTLGLRIVNFRAFTTVAESPAALRRVKDLLDGKLVAPGLTLKPLDRWNLVGHLVAMGDGEAASIFEAETARDHSGEGQKYAYAAGAGAASAEVKARYFADYVGPQTGGAPVQEDWLSQSLRPFNSWNQTALTEGYLTRALDALPEIKAHRKIFFLGAWLGAFIEGQNSVEAQAVVHAWLAGKGIDPDLRLKVLEVSDALDRTVRVRGKFPE